MQELMWKLKSTGWNWFVVIKFRGNKPRYAPRPTDSYRKIGRIPLCQRYPSIPISDIPVADYVPLDEKEWFKLLLCNFQAKYSIVTFLPRWLACPQSHPTP
jgi:hypothetical protein